MPKVKKITIVLRYMGGVYVGVPPHDLTAEDVDTVANTFGVAPDAARSILITSGHYALAPDVDAALGIKET